MTQEAARDGTAEVGPRRRCEDCRNWSASGACEKKAWAPKSADTAARAEACGYWDLRPCPSCVAPVQENPVAAVEDALRRSTVAAAKDSIWRLGALLDQSPAAAARALHLIGETAAAYGEMLAAIGVPGVRRRRDVVGTYAASASLNDSIASLDASPGGETFGNQALQQIVAAIPQIGKMIAGKRSEPRAPRGPTAFDIESLTRAYGEAKRAGLDESTVAALKAKLDEALASKQWGPPSGVDDADLGPPTADEEVTP